MAEDHSRVLDSLDSAVKDLTKTCRTLADGHVQLRSNQVAMEQQIAAVTSNHDGLATAVQSLQQAIGALSDDLQNVKASLH